MFPDQQKALAALNDVKKTYNLDTIGLKRQRPAQKAGRQRMSAAQRCSSSADTKKELMNPDNVKLLLRFIENQGIEPTDDYNTKMRKLTNASAVYSRRLNFQMKAEEVWCWIKDTRRSRNKKWMRPDTRHEITLIESQVHELFWGWKLDEDVVYAEGIVSLVNIHPYNHLQFAWLPMVHPHCAARTGSST